MSWDNGHITRSINIMKIQLSRHHGVKLPSGRMNFNKDEYCVSCINYKQNGLVNKARRTMKLRLIARILLNSQILSQIFAN